MDEIRRQAYLEAIGIDVWLARPEPGQARAIHCSETAGAEASLLLVCERPEQADTPLAEDLVRAFGGNGCWAWPSNSEEMPAQTLADIVDERLFTRVVLFGKGMSQEVAGRQSGKVIASAQIETTVSLDELSASATARQALWRQLFKDGVN